MANHHGMTHAEVSAILGVSAGRVRQIERRALQKLRVALARQGITADDVKAIPSQGEPFQVGQTGNQA